MERRLQKKHLGNFLELGPIGNFSDLQYLPVIHQKRARRLFKKILKSLHYFFLNTLFGALERRL